MTHRPDPTGLDGIDDGHRLERNALAGALRELRYDVGELTAAVLYGLGRLARRRR